MAAASSIRRPLNSSALSIAGAYRHTGEECLSLRPMNNTVEQDAQINQMGAPGLGHPSSQQAGKAPNPCGRQSLPPPNGPNRLFHGAVYGLAS